MTRRARPAWSPLSAEARALIASPERNGLAWGLVRLACGEAAQLGAFGVASRPSLYGSSDPIAESETRDRAQGDLFG